LIIRHSTYSAVSSKNTLLQTAFSPIFPTGNLLYRKLTFIISIFCVVLQFQTVHRCKYEILLPNFLFLTTWYLHLLNFKPRPLLNFVKPASHGVALFLIVFPHGRHVWFEKPSSDCFIDDTHNGAEFCCLT